MFRSIVVGCRAFVAALLAGCASSSVTESPFPSALSCYTLSLGTWTDGLPEELPPPPTAIQLTDSLGTTVLESGQRIVRTMPAGTPKAYPFQYWVPREQGDVFMVFSNGFTGMTMDLAPSGQDFTGRARAFFDFGTYDISAPVQLQRIPCM